ncbi:MAG TPA: glycoside hydrolase family 65 protein, partial [Halanaerobiales bacterium]|nr:glycoside hydrolase family 65 protein [Halanaerobiales bacterium]
MLVYHRKKLKIEPFFRYEPWKITEETFNSKNNLRNESIFSTGNGYMGVRGNLEEDYTGPLESSIPGVYINGVYASEQIIYGEVAPHQPEKSQTILNLANWLKINLYIDGEKFDMFKGKIEGYRRELNLKEGVLRRSLIWTSPSKKRLSIDIERFVSFTDVHTGLIRYNIKALNFQGNVKLVSEIDGNARNYI